MNEHFEPALPRQDAMSESPSADQTTRESTPPDQDSVLAVIGRCIRQVQNSIEAGAELGQIEFALFRMGLVRMLLLSLAVCGLLLSLWLVLLAATWAVLMTLTGSSLMAFAGLAILIALGMIWAGLQIRRWYRVSFFPRTRRQIDASLRQWNTAQ